jgi:hypothetical protein
MYTNIPVRNTVNILSNNSEISVHIKTENILLTSVIVNQNYFEFNATCYKQIEGLGMGIPTSALFAEAFLQWLEHMFIIKILLEHRIIGYYRYVDDILILYDKDVTYIDHAWMPAIMLAYYAFPRRYEFGERRWNDRLY